MLVFSLLAWSFWSMWKYNVLYSVFDIVILTRDLAIFFASRQDLLSGLFTTKSSSYIIVLHFCIVSQPDCLTFSRSRYLSVTYLRVELRMST